MKYRRNKGIYVMGTGSVQFRTGVKMKCIHSFLTAENWESCILAFTKSFFSSAYNLFSGQELDNVSEDVAVMIMCVYILPSLIYAINHTRTWLPLILIFTFDTKMPYVLKIHYAYTVFCGLMAISVLEQWERQASMLLIANTIQKCNEFFNFSVFFTYSTKFLLWN